MPVILAAMLVLALPLCSLAQFTYTTNNGDITITGYTGLGGNGNVTIPNTVNGYPVTTIGTNAFYNGHGIKSVTIPNSVTSIDDQAFAYCDLTSVMISDSVTSIGTNVFYYCASLTNVTIPDRVTSIGDQMFFGCINLKSVTIPSSVTSIGNHSFSGSGLANVTIPGTVTNIDYGAFWGCSLTNVTIGEGVTSIGDNAFTMCFGLTNVTIPDSVISIGNYAFFDCLGLTNVVIGNSVTSIGDGAFAVCSSLTNVVIGNSVTSIGDGAFGDCSSLTSVTIPSSVTGIGNEEFEGCSGLTNITVNKGNPNYASSDGVLFDKTVTTLIQYPEGLAGSYTIPNSVTNIGAEAFWSCYGLTSVTIGNSVISFGSRAYSYCNGLTNIAVDDANPNYASAGGVLFNKTLTTLIEYPAGLTGNYAIPNSVKSVDDDAFGKCYRLTSVTIPNSVTNIGDEAFEFCWSLTNVTIGNSIINIGVDAFSDCPLLRQAYFAGNAPSVDGSTNGSVFSGVGEPGTVYYMPGTTGWGATFGGWPTFFSYQPKPFISGVSSYHGAQNNHFNFTILWATNSSVVVEVSTNLLNWTPVITNTLIAGTNAFSDSTWTNYPQRFYRVRSQ